MSKLLLIGLDGATFDVLWPLAEAGRLPNLKRILDEGAWGTLQSTIPPITPTAWTSVFTGKNPGKHGIYDFQEIDRQTYERRGAHTVQHREKAIWDLLGDVNKRSVVIDVPYTYPPRPLNGRMLTGYGTPRRPETIFTYPTDFAHGLPAHLHKEIRVGLPRHRFDRSQALIDEWAEVMNGRQRLLTHLISQEEWDFFFTVFNITDNMGHIFWTYIDPKHPNYYKPEADTYRQAFFGAYEQSDKLLGELMALAGAETNTLIMSDHGFGSIHTRQYVFQRLIDGGFMQYQQSASTSWRNQLIQQMLRAYNRFPVLREWVKGLRPQNKGAVSKSLKRAGLMPDSKRIDVKRSRILPTDFGLQLWVNSSDQFAQGFISPSEKESLLRELSDYLIADRDPYTGASIIKATYRGEELFHGDVASAGPDLIIEFNNFYQPQDPVEQKNPNLEGGHTQEGIFLAHGPAIKQGQLDGTSLIDLAPTVLHLLQEPIPPDMDGRVLTDILTDAWQTVIQSDETAVHTTAHQQQETTEAEEAELLDQLRQLGYVD